MKRLLINVGRHFVWAFKLSGKFVIRESDYGALQIFAKTIPYSQPAANSNTNILSLDEEKILNLHLKKGGIKKRRRIVLQMIPISFFNLEGNLHLGGNGSICCLQICNHLVLGLNDRIAMQIVWHYKNSPTFVYWHQKKYKVSY